jgi:hypothetical protein
VEEDEDSEEKDIEEKLNYQDEEEDAGYDENYQFTHNRVKTENDKENIKDDKKESIDNTCEIY